MIVLGVIFLIVGVIQIFRGFCRIFDEDFKKLAEANKPFLCYLYFPITTFGFISVIVMLYYGYLYLTA